MPGTHLKAAGTATGGPPAASPQVTTYLSSSGGAR